MSIPPSHFLSHYVFPHNECQLFLLSNLTHHIGHPTHLIYHSTQMSPYQLQVSSSLLKKFTLWESWAGVQTLQHQTSSNCPYNRITHADVSVLMWVFSLSSFAWGAAYLIYTFSFPTAQGLFYMSTGWFQFFFHYLRRVDVCLINYHRVGGRGSIESSRYFVDMNR